MAQLKKADLEQMGETYFKSLEPERLIEVAKNLHELAIEQLEKLEQTSKNSSRPPSSDSPYKSAEPPVVEAKEQVTKEPGKDTAPEVEVELPTEKGFGKRKAGKQPGSKGHGRSKPLKVEQIIPHFPLTCMACNRSIEASQQDEKPHMGYHQLELVAAEQGFKVISNLHHYYGATCACGHHSQALPGEGEQSIIAGRKVQLKLQEQTLIGPMLASFLASLSVRYRLSRVKIQEFLHDWAGIELSVGCIDYSIRAAGLACDPVVKDLIEQLQQAEILHIDETPWYESGRLCWLWVAISSSCAVFFVGARTKEVLLTFVSTAFVGWLVSDGYGAYRWYEHRQRCLAHLIRKALALSGAVDAEAKQFAKWLLEEMRELIHDLATMGMDSADDPGTIRLKKVAQLARASNHPKLKALAGEILNDWEAMVAFVSNPQLPVTNNEAERALRHAVIARRIGFGTRSSEGSNAYAALLSVIETCRLRGMNPWEFLAQVITLRRQGLDSPLIPSLQLETI